MTVKRMTGQTAWGLALVLMMLIVGAVGGTAAYGQLTGLFTIYVKPFQDRPYWEVGRSTIALAGCSRLGSIGTLVAYRYSLGCMEVLVPYRGPEVILWNTYPQPRKRRAVKPKRRTTPSHLRRVRRAD
jgi:hypothetical protein